MILSVTIITKMRSIIYNYDILSQLIIVYLTQFEKLLNWKIGQLYDSFSVVCHVPYFLGKIIVLLSTR